MAGERRVGSIPQTYERIIIPSTHVQQQATGIHMRISEHAFPLIYTLKSDEREIIGTRIVEA